MNFKNIEKHLICMKCGGNLKVTYENGDGGMIMCLKCSAEYPIIKNVPRFLEGELLRNCYYFYYDIIEKDKKLNTYFLEQIGTNGSSDKTERLKSKTQRQFGYEWRIWKKQPNFVEDHYLDVMDKDEKFFVGKVGWDPAIGNGHDLYNAVKLVGKSGFMIGSDISFSVDSAYERFGQIDNLLIVQADLYQNFIKKNYLDFSQMIGLIQHLTQPKRGIEKVFEKVKVGGYFVGTVYIKPEDILTKLVIKVSNFMRVFTTKMPLRAVLLLSRLFALPSYLFFKLPQFILNKFEYVKNMNNLYPQNGTQNRKPNLDLLTNIWFDDFIAPIINYYTEEMIIDMTGNLNLKDYVYEQGIFRGYKR